MELLAVLPFPTRSIMKSRCDFILVQMALGELVSSLRRCNSSSTQTWGMISSGLLLRCFVHQVTNFMGEGFSPQRGGSTAARVQGEAELGSAQEPDLATTNPYHARCLHTAAPPEPRHPTPACAPTAAAVFP